jgi:hypothetical protein
MVVPTASGARRSDDPGLAIFADPSPLVVDGWSPSPRDDDTAGRIPVDHRRGDAGIWRIHPCERALARWVRQAAGAYLESKQHGGILALSALPEVRFDLDWLFAG